MASTASASRCFTRVRAQTFWTAFCGRTPRSCAPPPSAWPRPWTSPRCPHATFACRWWPATSTRPSPRCAAVPATWWWTAGMTTPSRRCAMRSSPRCWWSAPRCRWEPPSRPCAIASRCRCSHAGCSRSTPAEQHAPATRGRRGGTCTRPFRLAGRRPSGPTPRGWMPIRCATSTACRPTSRESSSARSRAPRPPCPRWCACSRHAAWRWMSSRTWPTSCASAPMASRSRTSSTGTSTTRTSATSGAASAGSRGDPRATTPGRPRTAWTSTRSSPGRRRPGTRARPRCAWSGAFTPTSPATSTHRCSRASRAPCPTCTCTRSPRSRCGRARTRWACRCASIWSG